MKHKNENTNNGTNDVPMLDTQKTIQAFLTQTKEKIIHGGFQSKTDLLSAIHDFDVIIRNENTDTFSNMQYFSKEIESLLALYDESKVTKPKDHSHLTQIERDDGTVLSNLTTDTKENITLKQMDPNQSIEKQLKNLYNQTASQNLDTLVQDTIESNYRMLQEKEKEEIHFETVTRSTKPNDAFILETVSPTLDALRWYAEKNHLLMEYTADGLGRDQNGNMYEANLRSDGNIYISRVRTTTFEDNKSVIPRSVVDIYTPIDIKEKSNMDSFYLDTLMEQITMENGQYRPDYKQVIEMMFETTTPPLDENAKRMYIEAVETRMLYGNARENTLMEQNTKMTNQSYEEKPKTLVYKNEENHHTTRGGFINAFLLTIVTVLFGTLCTMYIFLQILEHI